MNSFNKITHLSELNERARDIFKEIVESYIDSGIPIGSRTLALKGIGLSPATIRNTMADLSNLGLLDSQHMSAGRMPTNYGLRMFVDGLLEVTDLSQEEKQNIDRQINISDNNISNALSAASKFLSDIAGGAGLVTTPNKEATISQIEFVGLDNEKILVVLVFENGNVENRLIPRPIGITQSQLKETSNYLNHRIKGKTLHEGIIEIEADFKNAQKELDEVSAKLIKSGIAAWSGANSQDDRKLIVRGRANLLNEANAFDLERVRELFEELESKREIIQILDATKEGSSVKLFIGAENPLFALSGSALIAAPYLDGQNRVVGALGVIAPTRINYARIIPIVDYTAKILTKMVEKQG